MKQLIILLFILSTASFTQAQIISGQDTLYGNEWINFDQSYYKIMVAEDGIYRVGAQSLANAGVPISQIQGTDYQLFYNGEEVPIYTTTNNTFGNNDYLEFYGKKNRSELDRHLYQDPDAEMMNPLYSLFTDTSAYFLTWTDVGTPKRFQEVSNDLTNLPAPEQYYMEELVQNHFNAWAKEQNSQGVSVSNFTMSEGFSSSFQNASTFTLQPDAVYAAGPDANLHIRYSGNLKQHQQLITLNGQTLTTDEFFGYEVRKLDFPLTPGQLDGTLELKFQGLTDNNDRQRIANIILTYPRAFNFNNTPARHFSIPASGTRKYLEIQNFNAGATPVIYDLTNGLRLPVTNDNGLVKIALPPSAIDRDLILVNATDGIKPISTLTPIYFIDYSAIDAEFIFLSNPRLYDDGNGNNWVQEYANYRSSPDGGGYKTVIVDVQQVYDQFGWGLNRHSLSVRNFAHFVKREWEEVEYFFVVGKGREYRSVRTNDQLISSSNETFYVPTFGVPGSDNLLLAGGDGFTPVIPIGRIPVSTTSDIQTYLDKIRQFESNLTLPQTIEDKAWMKRVMHMGGGLSAGEQGIIRGYLNNLENIIEGGGFSGEVHSFYKNSSDPIQVSQTQQIFDIINDGISLITFFGHSSASAFDFSIDNPDNYENYGKYPLLISLGCYTGFIHGSGIGISERFNFYKDKGTIAFFAVSGQGFISSLHNFAQEFYKQIGNDLYGKGVGDVMKKAIAHFATGDFGTNLVRQQFTLNGDPALKMNPAPGPDFVVDASSVKFNPENINAQLEQFDLSFDIVNLGKGTSDSLIIKVTQELPDGSLIDVKEEYTTAPVFRKSFKFQIQSQGSESIGFNRFFISVDHDDNIVELPMPAAENNNQLITGSSPGIAIYITDNNAKVVYPPEFGIVSTPDVVLKASTTDPLLPERTYRIELDTTETFDSPQKLSTKIVQPGGVIKWQPTINWQNDIVYYWRISPDSISPEQGYTWDYSSFIYLENSTHGWNQSHFYQWKKDEFVNMELPGHGNLKFLDNVKDVLISNAVSDIKRPEIYINNAYAGRYWNAPEAGIYAFVFDSTSTVKWTNKDPYPYGIPQPNGYWVASYLFSTTTLEGRQELIEFLRDVVPENNYVLLHTVQHHLTSDYKPEEWESDQTTLGTDLFQLLETEGATLIRNTINTGSRPYVFGYKKGVGPIGEVLADSLTQIIDVYFALPGYWDRGEMLSTSIGPVKEWKTLQWEASSISLPEADTVSLDIFATNPLTLADSLLIKNIEPGDFDLSQINASEYPFLRLRFNSEDSINRTSAQLKYWRVLYDGLPDFAVNPGEGYSFNGDTIQQGNQINIKFVVENLSEQNGDSLLISYKYRSLSNEESVAFKTIEPLDGGDTVLAKYNFDTRLLAGPYSLNVELNPGEEQAELTRINNFFSTPFFVDQDRRNPTLDVTFDGVQILDGDLVSASPTIKIALKDENPFLALEDTSLFRLFIVYPDSAEVLKRVYFNDHIVSFMPAQTGGENKAVIEMTPQFSQDGEYQLIVQSQDVTGNQSGQYDYKIKFKVITKSSISSIVNFPNPFTTSTQFVYTLTGNISPPRFKIQIMTLSGRIVREITQDEIGALKIGTHKTDYAWDGRDEYGDQLAKGVYLYRVLVQDENGKEWENYETEADRYLQNKVGKMVLLR